MKAAKLKKLRGGRDGNPLEIEMRKTDQDSGDHPANANECPLDWMRSRGIIKGYQHMAGDTFRRDYEVAGIAPNRGTEIREKVDGGSAPTTVSDRRLDAMGRVNAALMACNTTSRLFVIDVCGEGKRLETVTAERGFSRYYVGPRFKEALDELARHYGLM